MCRPHPTRSWLLGWTPTQRWSLCWKWEPHATSSAPSSWLAPPRRELRYCSPPWRSMQGGRWILLMEWNQKDRLAFRCVPLSLSFTSFSDRHDLIKKLQALKDTNSELAGLLLEQVPWVMRNTLLSLFSAPVQGDVQQFHTASLTAQTLT